MVKLLATLAVADGQADINEVTLMMDELNIDTALVKASSEMDINEAINIIKFMEIGKKLEFASIAMKVVYADGKIHPQEGILIKKYFHLTGISEFIESSNDYLNKLKRFGLI